MHVRKLRVFHQQLLMAALSLALVYVARSGVVAHFDALVWSIAVGLVLGAVHGMRLLQRIERRQQRHDANRIFVKFMSVWELLLLAIASSHVILIAVIVVLIILSLFNWWSGLWLSLMVGSFGMAASVTSAVILLMYERRHGQVYFQYDASTWSGAEGMLYQQGEVVQALVPRGRVMVQGELWEAVSADGEFIEAGQRIEVLARKGLLLTVDKVDKSAAAG